MSDLTSIPGIGRTFKKDFGRIGITRVDQLIGADADELFEKLRTANAREDHPTSKNYLYVIRMAVYYANGGRDEPNSSGTIGRIQVESPGFRSEPVGSAVSLLLFSSAFQDFSAFRTNRVETQRSRGAEEKDYKEAASSFLCLPQLRFRLSAMQCAQGSQLTQRLTEVWSRRLFSKPSWR